MFKKDLLRKKKKRQFELVILGRKHSHDLTAVPVGLEIVVACYIQHHFVNTFSFYFILDTKMFKRTVKTEPESPRMG